jgi:prepilin-type N-terminal cleavage/methylation domain-containing protein
VRKLRNLFPVTPLSVRSPHRHDSRLTPPGSDAGLTLIEMVVAMMVFAILSLGVAYSMLAVMQSSRDSRGREVAVNLASQEIDLVRSVDNIFSIEPESRIVTVNGTSYTVTRDTDWVNSGLDSGDCGTGSGVLQHKKINIAVSWGAGSAQRTVRSDTIVAPTSKINDPTLGTIVVHVRRADGTGAQGVTVTAIPSSTPGTATTITTTIPATDVNGCTFALKVSPGNYDVSISKTDFVTETHLATETQTMQKVARGSATNVRFSYDRYVQFTPSFSNEAGVTATVPPMLDLSFVNTYGSFVSRLDAAKPRLHPFAAGYTIMAGKASSVSASTVSCDAIDPARWPAILNAEGTATRTGWTIPPTAAAPGETAAATVPLGVVTLSSPTATTVTATSTAPPSGSPAAADSPTCGTTMSYPLPSFTGTASFALPFGSWTFRTANGTVLGVAAGTTVTATTNGSVTSGVVTLDPRTAVAP